MRHGSEAAPLTASSPGQAAATAIPERLRPAYRHCLAIASAHYENFPVASRLLPARLRPHVAAVYAFARLADDVADEGSRPAAERLALIDAWRARLHACASASPPAGTGDDAVFAALGYTIETHRLPVGLLDDLLSAFAQDVTTTRYATWSDLLDYCRRSANPVGRLVLLLAGSHDDRLARSSDALCTALQLTNFWQDLSADWAKGRLYLPLEDASRLGARVEAFDPAALSAEWRDALEHAVSRTRRLFDEGRAVCDGVTGRLRIELRLTWLGGTAILDRVAAGLGRQPHVRPRLGAGDVLRLAWRAWRWQVR